MSNLALTLGMFGIGVAAVWAWRRWVSNEQPEEHPVWGGTGFAASRRRPSSFLDGAGHPTSIREYCDRDQRRWNGMQKQLEEIRNLPETQVEEWLL